MKMNVALTDSLDQFIIYNMCHLFAPYTPLETRRTVDTLIVLCRVSFSPLLGQLPLRSLYVSGTFSATESPTLRD